MCIYVWNLCVQLRGRCAQLEKTVRWWSDCTNNWREKWSCVRDERNQLREELRRTKLALNILQRQNEELLHRQEQLSFIANSNGRHILKASFLLSQSPSIKIKIRIFSDNSNLRLNEEIRGSVVTQQKVGQYNLTFIV